MKPSEWHLTERQCDVLKIAATGALSREIGEKLGVSPKTVDVHFDRLMLRMGARNRLEAVLWWDRANRAEAA